MEKDVKYGKILLTNTMYNFIGSSFAVYSHRIWDATNNESVNTLIILISIVLAMRKPASSPSYSESCLRLGNRTSGHT